MRVLAKRAVAAAFVFVCCGLVAPSLQAQTGEFLCSAGSRDGLPCDSFDQCPGGACVIAQGICSDGFICDCPSGTCSNNTACPDDATFGTCSGGVSPGLCCDVALNCVAGDSCVGTQKVCVGGNDQGFSCRNDSQCTGGGRCLSTGCYCDGGDFDGYTCAVNADCPSGRCDCSSVVPATPTRTPTTQRTNPPNTPNTPLPTSTRTPTRGTTPGTPARTSTPTKTGVVPTNTPTNAPPTATRAFTNTPISGVLAATISESRVGTVKLHLDSDPRTIPTAGVVTIMGQTFPFSRRISSPIISLRNEFGLPFTVPAGTTVHLQANTPTPGPVDVGYEAQGEGCAIQRTGQVGWSVPLGFLLLGIVKFAPRRRR